MQQTMRAPLRPSILCLTTNSTPRFREVIASIVSVVRNSHKRGRSSFDITATLDGLLSDAQCKEVEAHIANKSKGCSQGNILQSFAAALNDAVKFRSLVALVRDLAMRLPGMPNGDVLSTRELSRHWSMRSRSY